MRHNSGYKHSVLLLFPVLPSLDLYPEKRFRKNLTIISHIGHTSFPKKKIIVIITWATAAKKL